MSLVDDPYFGLVPEENLRHQPRGTTPTCQRVTRCTVCCDVYVGVVAFVHHVADRRCKPTDRTGAR